MKVDMSPEAVTTRLKTLDELWLLSVKLMNSFKVPVKKNHPEKVAKSYPIGNLVKDWFFRINEESQGNYLVEGVDLWGRKISLRSENPEAALKKCAEFAADSVDKDQSNKFN